MKKISTLTTFACATIISILLGCRTIYADSTVGICSNGKISDTIQNDETAKCTEIIVQTTNDLSSISFFEVTADTFVYLEPDANSDYEFVLYKGTVIRTDQKAKKSWIAFTTDNGTRYVPISKVKKHKHKWSTKCTGSIGHIERCSDCNITQVVTDKNPYTPCGSNVICQIAAGDWSDTTSYESIIFSTVLSNNYKNFKDAFRVRDFLADAFHTYTEYSGGSYYEGSVNLLKTVFSVIGLDGANTAYDLINLALREDEQEDVYGALAKIVDNLDKEPYNLQYCTH